jgi:uncharacterized protein YcbK (DUF882 family)
VRGNARRHCFNLERLRHDLAELAGQPVSITIDGPYRTVSHNRRIGGAGDSRHTHGDASDHFESQVDRWAEAIRRDGESLEHARARVLALCRSIFVGVGNEGSGTFHLDSRPGPRAWFVSWRPAR